MLLLKEWGASGFDWVLKQDAGSDDDESYYSDDGSDEETEDDSDEEIQLI
jgi:hypothetical protein